MILDTALKFLISTYLMVYGISEIWVPLMTRWGKWDPLMTWLEIRGHHFDDMMRKLGALDGAIENLGPFALWWRNGEIKKS